VCVYIYIYIAQSALTLLRGRPSQSNTISASLGTPHADLNYRYTIF